MLLDATTRKLQLVLTAAMTTANMPVCIYYVDDTSTATPSAGQSLSNSNGTTPVDILAGIAATKRKVNALTVNNIDTAAKTVIIYIDDNGTDYQQYAAVLQVGDVLGYTDTRGWYVNDAAGNQKMASANTQPFDATLTSISLLGTAADKLIYTTGIDTWAETGLTAFARSVLDDANEATFKATVNLEAGVDYQPYDADLTTWAGVTPGTGVATALTVAVGSAGSPVINGGALGTPTSGALDNCTTNTEGANNNSTQLATTAYADRLTAGTLAGAFTTGSFSGAVTLSNVINFPTSGYINNNNATWGAIYRPSQNGSSASHLWTNAAGTAAMYLSSSGELTLTGTPSANTHAATVGFVTGMLAGFANKITAKVATAAALPANTYSNGALGVGATLTADAAGVLTVDTYATVLNDIIVVKDEVSGLKNGVYKVTTEGTAGIAYVLTRHTSNDESVEFYGTTAFTTSGSVNIGTSWSCVTNTPTVGTTSIVFAQSGASTVYSASNGVVLTGTNFTADTTTVPLKTDNLSVFAATTSAQLRGLISDETGTGYLYFQDGALGTPASGVTDNLTTTTSVAAITDTDFVDINLAAGGKRKILWTAVKTYISSWLDTLTATWSNKTFVAPALGTPTSGDLRNCSLAVAPAIGGTTPAAGAFTTLSASGDVTLTNADEIINKTITSNAAYSYVTINTIPSSGAYGANTVGAILGCYTSTYSDVAAYQNKFVIQTSNVGSVGIALAAWGASGEITLYAGNRTTPVATISPTGLAVTGAISGTSIQNTPIGSTTASTGAFTTLSASGEITGTSQRLSSGTSSTTLAGNYALRLTAGATAANYAGIFFDGSTVYDSFFGRVPSALSGINDSVGYVTYAGGVPTLRALFSSTGLAVTGAISGTGTISSSAVTSIALSNNAANINGTDATGTITLANSIGDTYIQQFGPSHATRPNEMDITAASGIKLLNNTTVTGIISGTSIQNTPIGSTTASTGAFTTISATSTITGSNLSGTNTGDNATNTQYSGLAASKAEVAGSASQAFSALAVNTAKTTVASAATPDIFAVTTGQLIDYTGTATCTGFAAAPQAGMFRELYCADACLFTAGANLLIEGIKSGVTITLAAGALVKVRSITTTQFKMTYSVSGTFTATGTGFSGTAPTAAAEYMVENGWVHLYIQGSLYSTSNATTFTITGLPAAISMYSQTAITGTMEALNNGAVARAVGNVSTNIITLYCNGWNQPWTASGDKALVTELFHYKIR